MKTTKFQRVTAFMLAFVFVFCGGIFATGAETPGNSITANDIAELLNAISYNDYTIDNEKVPSAGSEMASHERQRVELPHCPT